MPKLASKTAIVTGGASGIGLAICKLFAQEGAAVEILDRNVDEMNKAVAEITAAGGGDLGHGFVHLVHVAVQNLHSRALLGKQLANGEADPGCASGNDSGFGCEFRHCRYCLVQ